MAKTRSRKLWLEVLEDRLTPSTLASNPWGMAWPNPGHITLSFAPDGTAVNNYQSNLFQTLNAVAPTSAWETAILQALQTWAVNANINIGVVADGGQALGCSGLAQGDSRFGDIRIAMAPLGSSSQYAFASGYDPSGSTWGGKIVFNNTYDFGINGSGQYDLFTVALHEAGHVFGFGDETTDPTSALYAYYTGVRTGLSAGDIANLQTLYGGPRSPDLEGNNSLATASYLTQAGQAPVNDSIAGLTDSHYYSFTAPASTNGTGLTSFTVQCQAAGISLLEPSVTVFNASGNVVASGAATSPLSNNVTLQVNNAQAGSTYYVEVTGATTSVFGIGAYQLSIQLPTTGTPSTPVTPPAAGNSFATAQVLTQTSGNAQGSAYNTTGALSTAGQGNYYQVTTPLLPVAGSELMTITAATVDNSGLSPYVTVYNAAYVPVSATVVNNGGGTFTVQLPSLVAGTVYYIEVSALPGTSQNVGNYALSAQFNNDTATSFDQVTNGSLSQTSSVSYQTLSVACSELVEISLSANVGTSTVASAVRMTIYDQNNNVVLSLVAYAGQPVSTGFCYLQAGMTYTVRYNAATQSGVPLPVLYWYVSARRLSDPMSATLINPTYAATGEVNMTTGSSSGGNAATQPIVGPYSNPTTGGTGNSPTTTTSSTTTTTSPTGSTSSTTTL
jgi:Matrixin